MPACQEREMQSTSYIAGQTIQKTEREEKIMVYKWSKEVFTSSFGPPSFLGAHIHSRVKKSLLWNPRY